MAAHLDIRPNMDSPVEDVLNFKTCCGARTFDQNLEVLVTNRGTDTVVVPSRFDLFGGSGVYSVRNLIPHGDIEIQPGATVAFYCEMDEKRWRAADRLVFYDIHGLEYAVDLPKG